MQCPASPLYSDAGLDYPTTPHRRGSSRIDYSKYKTKMCRNYALGLPCPFEDRCAFSHGHRADESHSARALAAMPGKQAHRRVRHSAAAAAAAAAARHESGVSVSSSDAGAGADSSSDSNSDTYASVLPPPPPYEAAVQDDFAMVHDEYAPPAYPTRYRYDPYSFAGVLYEP